METLVINATDETPSVTLDPEKGTLEFSGKSLPEDVTSFYTPVLEWLDEYAASPASVTNMIFKLVYFNTASSKLILDMLFKAEELSQEGNEVKISWYFHEDDEDMEEAGQEYADLIEVPFELVSYS